MDKEALIEKTKQHIKSLRKESPLLEEREFRIALGKVFIDLKDAKKNNSDVLKTIFTLK